MLPTELPYSSVVIVDTEFIANPGEPYDVVCLAARDLRSGQTMRLWRDELSDSPPFDIGRNSLFIAFAAHAELGSGTALGWEFPVHVLDLHAEYLCMTNGRMLADGNTGRGLIDALHAYGINSIGALTKDSMRRRIMAGRSTILREKQS